MTGRAEITAALSVALEHHIDPHNDPRIYWAREVTFDYATGNAIRVDYMVFKPLNNTVSGIEKGDFYCYEVKSSEDDFNSKHGHNFIGDFNYYIMPGRLFETVQNLIPYNVGVFIENGAGLQCAKKARRMNRSRPASEMLFMMWRSSRRELVNARRKKAREERGDK